MYPFAESWNVVVTGWEKFALGWQHWIWKLIFNAYNNNKPQQIVLFSVFSNQHLHTYNSTRFTKIAHTKTQTHTHQMKPVLLTTNASDTYLAEKCIFWQTFLPSERICAKLYLSMCEWMGFVSVQLDVMDKYGHTTNICKHLNWKLVLKFSDALIQINSNILSLLLVCSFALSLTLKQFEIEQ